MGFSLYLRLLTPFCIKKNKRKIEEKLQEMSKGLEGDCIDSLNSIFSGRDQVVEEIRSLLIDEMVTPLKDQVIEIQSCVDDKVARLAKAEQTLAELKKERVVLESQIAEIETFII